MALLTYRDIRHLRFMLRCNDARQRSYLGAVVQRRGPIPAVEALVRYGLATRGSGEDPGYWISDLGREVLDELGYYPPA